MVLYWITLIYKININLILYVKKRIKIYKLITIITFYNKIKINTINKWKFYKIKIIEIKFYKYF